MEDDGSASFVDTLGETHVEDHVEECTVTVPLIIEHDNIVKTEPIEIIGGLESMNEDGKVDNLITAHFPTDDIVNVVKKETDSNVNVEEQSLLTTSAELVQQQFIILTRTSDGNAGK